MPKGRRDSQLVEETGRGESSGGGGPLKKGPWTSTEDAILVDYVNKHGEGNWNAVQKHSGLSRCGKSCRLRWANHLRPDLKKGAFTPEEEQRIIELHAKMGNKWARMAAELPGRTDNEIKNFWNTRIKRLQRAGLPIYPEEVCLQVLNGTRESPNMDRLLDSETHGHDVLQAETFDIPDVQFKSLDFNRGFLPYSSMFVDLPMSIRKECANASSGCSFVLPTIPPCKRLRESETLVSGVDTNTSSGVLAFDQSMSYAQGKSGQPFGSSSYYSDLSPSDQMLLLSVLPGSHALSNGNSSSSEPSSRAMKLELPSLQYPNAQQNSWGTPTSPLPSLESIDTFIQSPPTEQTQSDCPSPRSSGLLEAVIYQSHGVRSPKKNLFEHSLDTIAVPGDIRENSPLNPCATELGAHGDPNSLLGHSTASVFSDYTAISGISSEEFQTVETKPGYDRNPESVYHLMQSVEKTENLDVLDYSRSDALIDSGWFGHSTGHEKDRSIPRDTIGALLGDDFNIDY